MDAVLFASTTAKIFWSMSRRSGEPVSGRVCAKKDEQGRTLHGRRTENRFGG
jgi:hypothetical protein